MSKTGREKCYEMAYQLELERFKAGDDTDNGREHEYSIVWIDGRDIPEVKFTSKYGAIELAFRDFKKRNDLKGTCRSYNGYQARIRNPKNKLVGMMFAD